MHDRLPPGTRLAAGAEAQQQLAGDMQGLQAADTALQAALTAQAAQSSGAGTGQGLTSQMSAAYSLMVRSLLNLPEPAVDMMDMRVHAPWSLYTSSTLACAPSAAANHASRQHPLAAQLRSCLHYQQHVAHCL